MRKKKDENSNTLKSSLKIEELKKIIEITNLVPFDAEIKMPSYTSSEAYSNPREYLDRLLIELSEFSLLVDYLKAKTAESIRNSPYVEDGEKEYVETLVIQLEEFIKNRSFLKLLVEITKQYRKHLEESAIKYQKHEPQIKGLKDLMRLQYSAAELEERLTLFSISRPRFKISSQYGGAARWYESLLEPNKKYLGGMFFDSAVDFMELTTDDQHQIKIEWGGLMRLIEGLDLRRFKQCAGCQKIIWAFRLDAETCSKKCSNLTSQRNYQSDEKKRKEYNERRRKTYSNKRKQLEAQIKAKYNKE